MVDGWEERPGGGGGGRGVEVRRSEVGRERKVWSQEERGRGVCVAHRHLIFPLTYYLPDTLYYSVFIYTSFFKKIHHYL